jgi:NAD(P)H dehydrogenase (quinone)
MRYAVTGGGGFLGRMTAEKLLDRVPANDVVVITRRPEGVDEALVDRGVEVRQANYMDRPALRAAFAGVDRAMITTVTFETTGLRVEQHRNAIESARDAGVTRIVLPSMPKVDEQHPTGAYALEYPASERVLRESGVEWTVLQNGPYAENLVPRAALAAATGELTSNAGSGRIAPVTHADCAAVAAATLVNDGHAGRTYVVTGPELFTQAELAELFSEVSDRPIRLVELSDEGHPPRLIRDGIPAPFPLLLTRHLKAVRLGYFDDCTAVVEDVTGRAAQPLRPVLEAARDAILQPAG